MDKSILFQIEKVEPKNSFPGEEKKTNLKLAIENVLLQRLNLYGGIKLPYGIMDIIYNGKIYPNGKMHNWMETGSNCQVFAYDILRYNGKSIPDLRSSELWADTSSLIIKEDYNKLDLLFFNKKNESWGAHVGIYIGNNKVLHNSNTVGKPVVWDLDYFKCFDQYKVLLGAKRF